MMLQETQWEAPSEGFIPAPEAWLAGQEANWIVSQHATEIDSAQPKITELSAASSSSPHPKGDAAVALSHESFSRLALDDTDNPRSSIAQAGNSLCLQPQEAATSADLTIASNQGPANDVPDKHGAQHSAAQQSATLLHMDNQLSLGSAVFAQDAAFLPARVETTGMMTTIPIQQGNHIRYDTTDSESDSDSMPAQFQALSGCANSNQTACQLNSVDQQATIDVAAAAEPDQPFDPGDASRSSASLRADTVSDNLVGDAMQGIMATTVVTHAAIQQAPAPDNRAAAMAGDMPSELDGAASGGDDPQQVAMPDALAASAPADLHRADQPDNDGTALEASRISLEPAAIQACISASCLTAKSAACGLLKSSLHEWPCQNVQSLLFRPSAALLSVQ